MKKNSFKAVVFLLISCTVMQAVAFGRDFNYHDKGKRDPFISLVTKDGRILPGAKSTSAVGNIDLEGIIWDPKGKSVAIINGKLLAERERLLNVQILKIKKTSVIVQKEGKVIVINLIKEGGKNGE